MSSKYKLRKCKEKLCYNLENIATAFTAFFDKFVVDFNEDLIERQVSTVITLLSLINV